MSVRAWALKPGELRPLTRGGLLLLAARCALRVEAWRVAAAAERWDDGVARVVDAAFAPDDAPAPVRAARALSRALSDAGADETNRTDGTPDEPIGRCRGYAHDVLAEAIDATTMADRKALVKHVGDVAKYAGSIAAVLGHAGRVRAPAGEDAVDWACGAMWAAIRADVAALVALGAIPPRLSAAPDRVAALRKLAPFWPGRRPAWATPGAHVRKRPDGGRRLG